MTGFLLFGVMALLLAIGVPISVTLGASVLATIFLSYDFTVSSGIIAQRIFGGAGIHIDHGDRVFHPCGELDDKGRDLKEPGGAGGLHRRQCQRRDVDGAGIGLCLFRGSFRIGDGPVRLA